MAYRDKPLGCPACGAELRRRQRRDVWRCVRCGAVHLTEAELGRWLRLVGPEVALEVEGALRGAVRRAFAHRAAEAVEHGRGDSASCATCHRDLRRISVCEVPFYCCEASGELWLPEASLQELLVWAERRQRACRSWASRLRSFLFAS